MTVTDRFLSVFATGAFWAALAGGIFLFKNETLDKSDGMGFITLEYHPVSLDVVYFDKPVQHIDPKR
jgi:hypothetical protein